jgi:hypothetical protein
VPTASPSHGCEIGRGWSLARPLPAHYIVICIVTAGRPRSSFRDTRIVFDTSPSIESIQVAASASGTSKWINT